MAIAAVQAVFSSRARICCTTHLRLLEEIHSLFHLRERMSDGLGGAASMTVRSIANFSDGSGVSTLVSHEIMQLLILPRIARLSTAGQLDRNRIRIRSRIRSRFRSFLCLSS